jgi:hypothetical protein
MKTSILVAALLWSVASLAQGKSGGAGSDNVVQEADKTVFRKKTVIDFTDVAIDGELTQPEGTYTLSKKKTRFKSLIKDRQDFVPELRDSKDNL